MLKKFVKKISMVLLSSSLLICTSMPAFASINVTANGIATTTATSTTPSSINNTAITASSTVLTDGSSSTQGLTGGSIGGFSVTVNDADMRDLQVTSTARVITRIVATSPFSNFVSFNSGDYRMNSQIGWHFLPGVQYTVLVQPETTAAVTVSMSKASAFNWVVQGTTTSEEGNILTGGQQEDYGIAFDKAGTYSITVSTANKLTASLNDTITPYQKVATLNNDSYEFNAVVVNSPSGTSQTKYTLSLLGTDTVGNGGAYTVTIVRLY
ncbi:MAG: hypothetical protein ACI8WT_000198 [Clostridium sp.]|jgi:hypothetical protein